ncbi:Clavaminate synthase-like protein [Trichodelitschia bisporula]|uniref:Clavaminate synthase-like protein n=1 Tax=Trichodelitschia bisporula TaxID=703511 RepID=A0A6G1I0J6_9PEZI|nr:Clavaminate synthase-like protein [Trichodelitschia bisporula]
MTATSSPATSSSDEGTFTSIPVLSLAQARDPATKSAFLTALRDALLNIGFLYLSDTGIPDALFDQVCTETLNFFNETTLPLDEKLKIEMKNEKSFLGWSRLNNETTAHRPDYREQLDLSTPQPLPTPTDPLYWNLKGPNQWPSPAHLPSFRPVLEQYMSLMSSLSTTFTSLIAEAISLPPTAFDSFFDANQQHKLKIVKYPEAPTSSLKPEDRQGVGPHKDSMLTSYLLQASPQLGLQAQNRAGDWIDVPPIPRTLVVAIGQGLEALTAGVCAATSHRVLSPARGSGPRYSVPFFQGVSYDAQFEAVEVPAHVLQLRDRSRARAGKDDVEFTFVKGRWGHLGEATLWNRVKSHPDVGERWYPELLAKIRETQKAEAEAASAAAAAQPAAAAVVAA